MVAVDDSITSDLDERQRALLHEASHNALRVVIIAAAVTAMVLNALYDDWGLVVPVAGIAFLGMFAEWFYRRRAGVHRELEAISVAADARRGLVTAASVKMSALIFASQMLQSYRTDTITVGGVAIDLVVAILFGLGIGMFTRMHARAELQREVSGNQSPMYERGRRLGRWFAEKIGYRR